MIRRNASLINAKKQMIVRIAHLVEKIAENATYTEIAQVLGTSQTSLYFIRKGYHENCSLDLLMNVLDKFSIDYQITLGSRKGHKTVTVAGIESAVGTRHTINRSGKTPRIERFA